MRVKNIRGRQGDWNALVEYDDGSTETLPCVHDHFWREGREYHDLWNGADLRHTNKFQTHMELMRSKRRVVMTRNETDPSRSRGHGTMKRTGYRGVFNIKNFVFNDDGIHFTIDGGVPMIQKGGKP